MTENALIRSEYDDEIEDMAEYVIDMMRGSEATEIGEWHEEWFDYVWTAVENSDIRSEENYGEIIEYSRSGIDERHYEDTGQLVREMMEDDVISRMEVLPQRGVNPPE